MTIPESAVKLAVAFAALLFLSAPSTTPASPDGGLVASPKGNQIITSSPDGTRLYIWKPSDVVTNPANGSFPIEWIVQRVDAGEKSIRIINVR